MKSGRHPFLSSSSLTPPAHRRPCPSSPVQASAATHLLASFRVLGCGLGGVCGPSIDVSEPQASQLVYCGVSPSQATCMGSVPHWHCLITMANPSYFSTRTKLESSGSARLTCTHCRAVQVIRTAAGASSGVSSAVVKCPALAAASSWRCRWLLLRTVLAIPPTNSGLSSRSPTATGTGLQSSVRFTADVTTWRRVPMLPHGAECFLAACSCRRHCHQPRLRPRPLDQRRPEHTRNLELRHLDRLAQSPLQGTWQRLQQGSWKVCLPGCLGCLSLCQPLVPRRAVASARLSRATDATMSGAATSARVRPSSPSPASYTSKALNARRR
jgi:hypothetical protein